MKSLYNKKKAKKANPSSPALDSQNLLEQLQAKAKASSSHFSGDYLQRGLSAEEVAQAESKGLSNHEAHSSQPSLGQIVKRNLFNYFNLLNLLLGLAVFAVTWSKPAQWTNLAFLGVVLWNSGIATIQELRARRTLARLQLQTASRIQVLRDGHWVEMDSQQIVEGDLFRLQTGQQVPVDAVVLPGQDGAELDESQQSGESKPIAKQAGDLLLSGSAVVSGEVQARALAVGESRFVQQISRQAQADRHDRSILLSQLDRLVRSIACFILPLGGILFLKNILTQKAGSLDAAVISTVANLVSMLPEGLILLASVAFMVSVLNLAKHKVMVNSLASIEGLARVNCLCLDKTGTLTTGAMKVVHFLPLDRASAQSCLEILQQISQLAPKNATQEALADFLQQEGVSSASAAQVQDFLPFASSRKYAAIQLDDGSCYFQGAPSFVLPSMAEELSAKIAEYTQQGLRCLLLAKGSFPSSEGLKPFAEKAPDGLTPLALLLLSDEIRSDAAQTLAFFHQQGVTLKLISGDDPRTVLSLAKRLDPEHFSRLIDMKEQGSELEDLLPLVENYDVFGRVSPFQKRALVKALQHKGYNVAMTGDGVNDVPALSAADCGVAMASGSDATRAAARLVLLDNRLASMCEAVYEGRRVINNLRQVATLFVVKTSYATLMAFLMLVLPLVYPLYPIQASLLSALTVGIPAFFLALKPNRQLVSGDFFGYVLPRAIPAGLAVSAEWLSIQMIAAHHRLDFQSISTLSLLAIIPISLWVLYRCSQPLDFMKGLILGASALSLALMLFCFPHFFQLTPPYQSPIPQLLLPLLVLSCLFYLLCRQLALTLQGKRGKALYSWMRSHFEASKKAIQRSIAKFFHR